MAGVNPAYMARQMRHSLEVFFKVYADWIDGEGDDREIAKLERAIGQCAPICPQTEKTRRKNKKADHQNRLFSLYNNDLQTLAERRGFEPRIGY